MPSMHLRGFSGGLVDEYIGAAMNKWALADNLIINPDRNLVSRMGSMNDFVDPLLSRVNESVDTRRIGLAIPSYGALLKQVGQTLQYFNDNSLVSLKGPDGGEAFPLVDSDDAGFCYSRWNNHIYITSDELNQRVLKVFSSTSDIYGLKLISSGLPIPKGSPVFLDEVVGGDDTYIYAFVYKYNYVVDGVTFVERSAPIYVQRTEIESPALFVDVSALKLENLEGDHFDVDSTNLVIEIYRTSANGTVFYLCWNGLDPVDAQNPSAGIVDVGEWGDTNLSLYTSGGGVENTAPPVCKYLHMTSGFGYYANGIDPLSGEVLRNTIWQSKQFDPDAVPYSFFVEVDEEVMGISSVRGIPVVFCENSIYRIDGFFDLNNSGGMNPLKISDTIGCISHNSIVQTLDWLYFAAKDGFYRTNGYDIQSLSDNEMNSFTAQYRTFVGNHSKNKRICGVYNEADKRVFWAVEKRTLENESDNNALMVFDARHGVFTSWSSGWKDDASGLYKDQFNGCFRPSALAIMNDKLHRCDCTGYTFVHDQVVLTDPKVFKDDPYVAEWPRNPIIYNYLSAAIDFNSPETIKWVESIIFKAKTRIDYNVSPAITFNTSVQLRSDNDDKKRFYDVSGITDRRSTAWGDPSYVWSDMELWEEKHGLILHKRFFPTQQGKRCSFKQLQITNLFSKIYLSDNWSEAFIDGDRVKMPVHEGLGDFTNGSDIIENADTSAVNVGDLIAALYIPDGTKVLEVGEDFIKMTHKASGDGSESYFTSKSFPLDVDDMWVSFASDCYCSKYKIEGIGGFPYGSEIFLPEVPDDNPSGKWEISGFFKGDALCLYELIINFVPLSESFDKFKAEVGNGSGGRVRDAVSPDLIGDCIVFTNGVEP